MASFVRAFASRARPRSRYACASFGFFATFACRFLMDGAPDEECPKMCPFRKSLSPLFPEPTPRKTKVRANTKASRAKTHFADRRMRPKKSCDSTDLALPLTLPVRLGGRGA